MSVMEFEARIGAAPFRSHVQRRDALKRANEIRYCRARMKRDLAAGRISVHAFFAEEKCDTMKVVDLLIAIPKVGRVKANKVLVQCRISPSKTLGGMTARQHDELVMALGAFPSVRGGTLQR